jgi:hypothetical protein
MIDPDTFVSAQAHQASGMIAAQLNCAPSEALHRMQIRAEAMDYTLDTIAELVLDGVIRFDD